MKKFLLILGLTTVMSCAAIKLTPCTQTAIYWQSVAAINTANGIRAGKLALEATKNKKTDSAIIYGNEVIAFGIVAKSAQDSAIFYYKNCDSTK